MSSLALLTALAAFSPTAVANTGCNSDLPGGNDCTGQYGNDGNGNGFATNGNVTIDSDVKGSVYGGYSNDDDAYYNTVTLEGGAVTQNIYGGQGGGFNAIYNTVTINGGTVEGTVYGGVVTDDTGDAFSGNLLIMNSDSASIHSAQNFHVIEFNHDGKANIGEFITTNGTITNIDTDPAYTGTGHNVTFDGNITGGGGISKVGTGTLTLSGNNTYTGATSVSEGTLAGNIPVGTDLRLYRVDTTYDGKGTARTVGALTGDPGSTIKNTAGLTVQSGDFRGTIDDTNTDLIKTGAGTLTLNGPNTYTGATVVKEGTLFLDRAGSLTSNKLSLYSGTTFANSNGGLSLAGGTLTTHGAGANYVGILYAQNATLNFIDPTADSPLLNVDGTANISGSKVNIGISGGTPLAAGSTLTLLKSNVSLTANGVTHGTGIGGISKLYTFDLSVDGVNNALMANNLKIATTDDAKQKSPAEGMAASVATLNQGGDLAAGLGLSSAAAAAQGASGTVAGFTATTGGSSRYKTGSHVDVDSVAFMAGLAKTFPLGRADALAGAFYEMGYSSYSTHNLGADDVAIRGDGDSHYFGGGLMGRIGSTEGATKGLYVEATARIGSLRNSYHSNDLNPELGRAQYSTHNLYYGAHVGMGYLWNVAPKTSLDLSAKYFWNHADGASVTILGDDVRFGAVDSHRTRLGARLSYAADSNIIPYVAAAWEYEFDGAVHSVVAGNDIAAPSLKGSTGIGELGLTWAPDNANGFSADVAVQGYVGKRQGGGGTLRAKWAF